LFLPREPRPLQRAGAYPAGTYRLGTNAVAMRPTILAVVRVLTGLFFVASGLAKLFDTHAFVEIAQQYAARPLASFAVILPPRQKPLIISGFFYFRTYFGQKLLVFQLNIKVGKFRLG